MDKQGKIISSIKENFLFYSENKKKTQIFSWALYDWANSAYSTSVMAGFFPLFFKQYWSTGVDTTLTTARLGNAISISSLLIAFLSPSLGALADLRGIKKKLTGFFMLVGVLSCATLSIIPSGNWFYAVLAYSFAMVGFNASCVYYDSLLPSIAPGRDSDFVSSLGYSLGYLGGGILFLVNVFMYLQPHYFGISDGVKAIQWSFFSVSLWWSFFSIPLFIFVPEPTVQKDHQPIWKSTIAAINQLHQTLQHLILKDHNTLIFLISFWFYIDGVYTIMTMAVDFGISIGLSSQSLITSLLLVQFIGFPASLFTSILAKKFGAKLPIIISIGIYSMTIIFATQMTQEIHFYILASMIGFFQGGVQALSRSLFSRMIPPHASGEYFGLFNLVGRFASIIGPALVGWGAYLTGSSRLGLLGILLLFGLGAALLLMVKEPNS